MASASRQPSRQSSAFSRRSPPRRRTAFATDSFLFKQKAITHLWFPEKDRVEPEAPIVAVPVARLLDDEFQRFHPGKVNFVTGFGRAANDGRTKCLLAIDLDDKSH